MNVQTLYQVLEQRTVRDALADHVRDGNHVTWMCLLDALADAAPRADIDSLATAASVLVKVARLFLVPG